MVNVDFTVENHGTIALLQPHTPAAHAWVDENLPADCLLFGNAIAVEPRYVGPIVSGILDAGLEVA